MCVCWRKEGRVRQQTYVATPEHQPLVSVAHSDTYGLMWPPAVWRGWLAHLPSCPAKLHAGHDTPAWQYASARPWQLAYGNLLPPVERESQGGQWGQLESYAERNKYMSENGIQSVAKKKGKIYVSWRSLERTFLAVGVCTEHSGWDEWRLFF